MNDQHHTTDEHRKHRCRTRRSHRSRHRRFASEFSDEMGDLMGGIFGIRRPLRFLAHKLELDDGQTAKLAEIIDDLKTERAQAAVDDRRAQKLYVEAFSGDSFDAEKAKKASDRRIQTTEKVQNAVTEALSQIHAVLNPEQRVRMAYLIRSGALNF